MKTKNITILRFFFLLITQFLLIFSLSAQLQIGGGGGGRGFSHTITAPSGPATLNQTVQYYVDYSQDGAVASPNWVAGGGTVTNTWIASQRYYATVRWDAVGQGSLSFKSEFTTKAFRFIDVIPAANISGTSSPYEGQTVTYTHSGATGSGANVNNYSWTLTGGTVVSENKSARSITIRWTSQGSRTLSVRYLLGSTTYTLDTNTINVGPPDFTGTTTVTHGNSATYTHTGQQSLSGYSWVAEGGTITNENDGAKQVTVRWDPSNGGTRRLRLYYSGSLKRTKTITVNMPSISGASSALLNDTQTFTHNAGFASSGYTWSADRGTVTGTNTGAKQGTIRWTDNGTNVVRLYYNGYQLATRNVSVSDITLSGTTNTVHGNAITYTHNGGGTLSSYNYTVDGGSIEALNYATKQVTIRWTSTGARSLSIRYGTTTQKTQNVTVTAPTISGSPASALNDEYTYTHNGGFGSSNYTWSTSSGDQVLSTNAAQKNALIRWSNSGTRTVYLYYSGTLLRTYNVSVGIINLSPNFLGNPMHGESVSFIHNGGGNASNYDYVISDGEVVSRNDASKEVTVRFTGVGSQSLSIKYGTTTQDTHNVTVDAPSISGASTALQNDELTYTHNGGYASASYTWSAGSGGTVLSVNDAQKNALVRWENSGGQLISLYHGSDWMDSYAVTVTDLAITGYTSLSQGEIIGYTHNGGGNLNNYEWDPQGGTVVSQDPANKYVLIRWNEVGSRTLSLKYDGVTQESVAINITSPTITGPDETVLDRTIDTYTHNGSGLTEGYSWSATNGTIVSEDPANKSVNVRWDDVSGTLNLIYEGYQVQTKSVTGYAPLFIQATKGTNLRSTSPLVIKSTDTFSNYHWFKDDVFLTTTSVDTIAPIVTGNYMLKDTTAGGLIRRSNTIRVIDQPFWEQEKNMVVTYDLRKEGLDPLNYENYTLDDAYTTVNYVDGLNRPIQTIAKGQSFDSKDIVQPYQYDIKGRMAKGYLPYVADQNTGFYRDLALENDLLLRSYNQSEQEIYYTTNPNVTQDAAPFAQTVFEDNPRGRVLEQGAVGADWQPGTGHTARYTYRFNTAADSVRKWREDGTTNGYYASNKLQVVEITDENDNLVRTYTNMRGQTLLKQVEVSAGEWLETYSVYDKMGRMKYVIPPQAIEELGAATSMSATFIADWVNSYTYDNRGRLVEKKVPGAAPEYYIYDEMDRLILSQNGKMRESNRWSFVKYDDRDRAVYSGLYTDAVNTTRAAMQSEADAQDYDVSPYYEYPEVNATYHGYSNVSFPTANLEIHSVVYYDSYDFDRNGTDDVTYDAAHYQDSIPAENYPVRIGQMTGGKTRVLGTTTWLQSSMFYDEWGRAIQSVADNHLGGSDKVSVMIDDKGQIRKTKSTHGNGSTTYDEFREYHYHANGALVNTYHALDDEMTNKKLISSLNYNPLGELREKNLFSENNGLSFLQSVDYSYNIRGWLTAINDAALSQESDDFFGMEITYNTAASGLNNTAYYNGNISAIKWSDHGEAGSGIEKAYTYDYDRSDRFTGANFHEKSGAWGTSSAFGVNNLTYDKNGNILSLNRADSTGASADKLTYIYQANQLLMVSDTSSSVAVFEDGNVVGNDYSYDGSGNLTQDKNKNITSIAYNHLNLPTEIVFDPSEWLDKITYTYTASGQKVKMEMWRNSAVEKTIDYAGSYHYSDDVLQYIHFEEGQIMMDGSEPDYQVFLRDHLGNTRKVANRETFVTVEDFEDTASDLTDLRLHTSSLDNSTLPLASNDGVSLVQSGQAAALGVFRVKRQDVFNLSVIAHYKSNPTGNTFATLAFNTLASSFNGPLSSASETTVSGTDNAFNQALAGMNGGKNDSHTSPRAFLNYILFDENMGYKSAGFVQIQEGVNSKDTLSINNIIAEEKGYLLVYLSNENQETVDMYFDELTIEQRQATLLQSIDYYPFGSIASSRTYLSEDRKNHLYNAGVELNDSTGYYETFYRHYDATIGRFHSIDPVASKYASLSPYNYAFNDPVSINDPLGDDPNGSPFLSDDNGWNEVARQNGAKLFAQYGKRISPFTSNHWSSQLFGTIDERAQREWDEWTYGEASKTLLVQILSFIDMALNGNGGTWHSSNPSEAVFFDDSKSGNKLALNTGIAYTNYHKSWGNTIAKSEDMARYEYGLKSGEWLKYAIASIDPEDCPSCYLADFLRESYFLPTGTGFMLNPFFKAEAIFVDSGANLFGEEFDAGRFLILVGKDKGKALRFLEYAVGGATEAGGNAELGRIDYSGNPADFRASMLEGYRHKAWIGVSAEAVGVGLGFSRSNLYDGSYLIGTHFQVGYGASTPIISGGYNWGEVILK